MISVFKTSVSDRKGVKMVKPLLDQIVPDARWNFDLKDCDNILRIDSQEARTDLIIEVLKASGFECVELE